MLAEHPPLKLECIDRLHLNVYVPLLQSLAGVPYFFREVRGHPVPSSASMARITWRFVNELERYAECEGADLIRFQGGERRDERTQHHVDDLDQYEIRGVRHDSVGVKLEGLDGSLLGEQPFDIEAGVDDQLQRSRPLANSGAERRPTSRYTCLAPTGVRRC